MMRNPNVRPSVGKVGTHGKFMVEVIRLPSGTRSFARRFLTEEEAKDFYDRTVHAHQQKANRERHAYVVAVFETKGERRTELEREIATTHITPI